MPYKVSQMNSTQQIVLSELIRRENFDPFYTPMTTATATMLEVLEELFKVDSDLSSIAYRSQLIKCRLDYSLLSLKRLDKFIIALRQHRSIEHLELADVPSIRRLFLCLTAYVGEVFSRARGQAALWFALDEINNFSDLNKLAKHNFPDMWQAIGLYSENVEIPEVERAFLVLFSSNKKSISEENVGYFLPAKAIYENLVGNPITSVYDYVVDYLEVVDVILSEESTIPEISKVFVEAGLQENINNLLPQQRYYLQIKKPNWLNENDALYPQISNLQNLYKSGKVIWAVLIQANKQLFNTIKNNEPNGYPAEIIYDPTGRTHLAELLNYKAKVNDSDNTFLDNYLLPIKKTSILVWRLHLPNGLLSMDIFPIIISEKNEDIITLLPARFWNDEFVQAWLSTAAKAHSKKDFNLSARLHKKESDRLPAWTLSNTISIEELTSNKLYPDLLTLFPEHQFTPKQSDKNDDSNILITLPRKEDFFTFNSGVSAKIQTDENSRSHDKPLELSLEQDSIHPTTLILENRESLRTQESQLDDEVKSLIQEIERYERNNTSIMDIISKYPLLLVFISMLVIFVVRKTFNI